jgi:hypothetical protein
LLWSWASFALFASSGAKGCAFARPQRMSGLIATALFSLVLLAYAPGGAWAQAPEAAPPAQVRELLKLLGEPKVRSWLEDELKRVPAQNQTRPASLSRLTAERIALSRTRVDHLGAAASRLPEEFRNAVAVLSGELQSRGFLEVLALDFGFALLGLGAEWGFWRATHAARLLAEHEPLEPVARPLRTTGVRFGFGLAAVAVFAAGSIGAFLALDWPPVLKSIVLAYLLAALAWRVTLLVSRLLLEPRVRSEDAASAFGHTQWALADQSRPGPTALMIQIASTSFREMFHPGGAFSLESALFWAARSGGPAEPRWSAGSRDSR